MTDTDIVARLAREAGLARPDDPRTGYARFAALVAEECAKVCEAKETELWDSYGLTKDPHTEGMSDGASQCAAAIRARFVHSPKPLT